MSNVMNAKKSYTLNYLSEEFFTSYNTTLYPEIESKGNRPYMVVLVNIENNTFAIPFRTNIPHNNCYKFRNSSRQTKSVTGLDYTKAVIVNDEKYIGGPARIDDKEYVELNKNYPFIIKQFKKFVSDYIEFINGKDSYYAAKKFRFTTLKYFETELLHSNEQSKLENRIHQAQLRASEILSSAANKKKKTEELEKE